MRASKACGARPGQRIPRVPSPGYVGLPGVRTRGSSGRIGLLFPRSRRPVAPPGICTPASPFLRLRTTAGFGVFRIATSVMSQRSRGRPSPPFGGLGPSAPDSGVGSDQSSSWLPGPEGLDGPPVDPPLPDIGDCFLPWQLELANITEVHRPRKGALTAVIPRKRRSVCLWTRRGRALCGAKWHIRRCVVGHLAGTRPGGRGWFALPGSHSSGRAPNARSDRRGDAVRPSGVPGGGQRRAVGPGSAAGRRRGAGSAGLARGAIEPAPGQVPGALGKPQVASGQRPPWAAAGAAPSGRRDGCTSGTRRCYHIRSSCPPYPLHESNGVARVEGSECGFARQCLNKIFGSCMSCRICLVASPSSPNPLVASRSGRPAWRRR